MLIQINLINRRRILPENFTIIKGWLIRLLFLVSCFGFSLPKGFLLLLFTLLNFFLCLFFSNFWLYLRQIFRFTLVKPPEDFIMAFFPLSIRIEVWYIEFLFWQFFFFIIVVLFIVIWFFFGVILVIIWIRDRVIRCRFILIISFWNFLLILFELPCV